LLGLAGGPIIEPLISEPRQRWGDPFVYYECVFVAGSPWLRAWAALAFAPASGLEAG
jgi:hypothetical protein